MYTKSNTQSIKQLPSRITDMRSLGYAQVHTMVPRLHGAHNLCPSGAGSQLKPSSLQLTSQHRQRLGREVTTQVLVRRQGVGDAKPVTRHTARPREVAGRGDAQGLVHWQRGVVRKEAQQ